MQTLTVKVFHYKSSLCGQIYDEYYLVQHGVIPLVVNIVAPRPFTVLPSTTATMCIEVIKCNFLFVLKVHKMIIL